MSNEIVLNATSPESKPVAFSFITSKGDTLLRMYEDNELWINPVLRNNEGAIEFLKCVRMIQELSGVSNHKRIQLPEQSMVDLLLLEDDIRREADMSRGMNEHPAIRDRLLEFADRLHKGMTALEQTHGTEHQDRV